LVWRAEAPPELPVPAATAPGRSFGDYPSFAAFMSSMAGLNPAVVTNELEAISHSLQAYRQAYE
jgi:hypothetical protein